MKCHYEVLEVSRDADQAEIKSKYRQLALKWHPDKNLTNMEYAKEQFQLVQQAYEILSDPYERAWYDKHREQIIRGADSEFEDNYLDVFQYFTTNCFKGYADDENGFYTVYRNVFDKIIEEEAKFIEDKLFNNMPRFGYSDSDYTEVVGPFYSYWQSFSTNKSYVWLDPHNINEISSRRVIKFVDKDNKKVRQKAKKERNEEIRNLVAFIKKRDKRVQEYNKLVETKIKENRLKQEKISKMKRLERRKELNESGVQAEWTKFDNVKSELEDIEKHLAVEFGEELSNSDEEEENIDSNWHCVACNKIFKTQKALKNHEASKKHKENLQILKKIMIEENKYIDENTDFLEDLEDLSSQSEKETHIKTKKKKKKKHKILNNENEENHGKVLNDEKCDDIEKHSAEDFISKEKNKNKKSSNKTKPDEMKNKNDLGTNKIKLKANKTKNKVQSVIDLDKNRYCAVCKSEFPSKTKLFDHLKGTGHAIFLPPNSKNTKLSKAK